MRFECGRGGKRGGKGQVISHFYEWCKDGSEAALFVLFFFTVQKFLTDHIYIYIYVYIYSVLTLVLLIHKTGP